MPLKIAPPSCQALLAVKLVLDACKLALFQLAMAPPPPVVVTVALLPTNSPPVRLSTPPLKMAPPAPAVLVGGLADGPRGLGLPAGMPKLGWLAAQKMHGKALESAKLALKLELLTVVVMLVLRAPPAPPEQLSTKLLPAMDRPPGRGTTPL